MKEKTQISDSKWVYLLLGISILYFLIKGIQYALIESYIPLVFWVCSLGMLIYGWRATGKNFRRTLRIWGIILILWGLARLLVEIMFYLAPGITESHIREQFTIFQNLISVLSLIAGIYLIKKATMIE